MTGGLDLERRYNCLYKGGGGDLIGWNVVSQGLIRGGGMCVCTEEGVCVCVCASGGTLVFANQAPLTLNEQNGKISLSSGQLLIVTINEQ